MKGISLYKVEGGKMLRLSLEHDGKRVCSVKIAGDFFMHPEESISLLEHGLKGTPLDESSLQERASSIVRENSIQLFGFAPADLAKAVMRAVSK